MAFHRPLGLGDSNSILFPQDKPQFPSAREGVNALMVFDLSTAGSMHSDRGHIPIAEFQKGVRIFYDVLTGEF